MTPGTDRTQYREVLASLVQQTQTRYPALNGRLTKATALALMHDVEIHDDGTATVHSASDPTRHYRIVEGTCTCRDFEQAPEHLCQHRLAAGLVRKARALLPPAPGPAPVPCPEAAFALTLKGTLGGIDAMITVRGQTPAEFQANLQHVKGLLDPTPPAPTAISTGQGEGWCTKHGLQMAQSHKDGRSWWSHRTDQGWCKGR